MTLEELLLSDNVVEEIRNNIDFLTNLIPEIIPMIGFDHKNPHHHLDVWEHTLLALSLSEKDYIIRLSLLLHDIGKPYSYKEGIVRHYYNHPIVSANISKDILIRLGYNKEFINEICFLIRYHDSLITKEEIEKNYDLALTHYKIQECDMLAHNPLEINIRKEMLNKTKKLFYEDK